MNAMPAGSASGIHRISPRSTTPRLWIGRGCRSRSAVAKKPRRAVPITRATGACPERGAASGGVIRTSQRMTPSTAEGVARRYCEGP
ncbi:MAG: hypothetical protein K0S37_3929 [Microbacterium sp.]|jgi:hypothetical protein|nr:hypothetical protein [Microbacterium sp.]